MICLLQTSQSRSLALGNETAAKRQIILSSDNEKFTIPVTPRSYEIKTAQNNETIDILDFGEAMLFGNAKLKRLSFSGFFPHPKHDYPFVVGDVKTPIECVELLTKWKEAKKPIRVRSAKKLSQHCQKASFRIAFKKHLKVTLKRLWQRDIF